jgi:hypothetical protein
MIMKSLVQPEHRWFIWTIVFLIVSGVSLVSYIMITQINDETQMLQFTPLIYRIK